MSTIGRDLSKPIMVLAGLAYLSGLAVALIWMRLSPLIILMLTVGGIALLVMTLRPIVAVHAFIMLLNVENLVSTKQGFTGMKALGAIILVGWLLSMAARRKIAVQWNTLVMAALLFVTWCAVSLLYAFDSELALSRLFTYVQLTTAMVMFHSVVDDGPKLRAVLWSIVLWVLLSTVVALAEYYTGLTRVAVGLAGNRNLLVVYIGIGTVCSTMLYMETDRVVPKLFLASALPVFFLGLALTMSRAGLIAQIVALLVVWYRIAREKGFLILTLSVALLCVIALVLPDAFWKRAGTIVPSIKRQENTFGVRVRLWKVGWRMIEDRPVTGVGPGNFMAAFPHYGPGELVSKKLVTHNAYVGVAAEQGLVGAVLFLALHLIALREARRAIRAGEEGASRELRCFAVAAEAGILVIMVNALTLNSEIFKILWMLFGLAMSLGHMAQRVIKEQEVRAGLNPVRVTP